MVNNVSILKVDAGHKDGQGVYGSVWGITLIAYSVKYIMLIEDLRISMMLSGKHMYHIQPCLHVSFYTNWPRQGIYLYCLATRLYMY